MTTVLGVDALLARLARAAAIGEVAQHAAQTELAEEVASVARQLSPVDTGTLQASITADADRVYTDVAYAPFVEYGTSDTPAQPFMRPAADEADGTRSEAVAKAIMDRA
jgi:HK97 gp10 family phage protein